MRNILNEFELEGISKTHTLPNINTFYEAGSDFNFAYDLYKEGRHTEVIEALKITLDVQELSLKAFSYFALGAYEGALNILNKVILTCGSYHCYFHYFGFNTLSNLIVISQQLNYEKLNLFLEKAEFLYKHGFAKGIDFKSPEDFKKDLLPKNKNICIFNESHLLQKINGACDLYEKRDFAQSLKQFESIFEENEVEHYSYHIFLSNQHYLRGLCFEILGMQEVARVDFEKALLMERKNPFNSQIKYEITKYKII